MFQVGVNSWVTVAEATAFNLDLWDGSYWASLNNTQRQQLLTTAYYWIQSAGYSISPTSVAENVKQAQMLLAKEVYKSYDDYIKRNTLFASGVRSFNYEGWQETLTASQLPANIQDLLSDSITGAGGKFIEFTRDY